MRGRPSATLLVLLLAVSSAEAGDADEASGHTRVAAGYRSLGTGRDELDLEVGYATEHFEVGWQFAWRRYAASDPVLTGEQYTAGLLWSWLPLRGRAGGLRLDIEPWAAVSTDLREVATLVPISLPYGLETRASLFATVRLGGLRASPSVAVVGKLARTSRTLDVVTKGSDREGAWRVSLPLALGAHLRLEAAYSKAFRSAAYIGQERSQLAVGWAF